MHASNEKEVCSFLKMSGISFSELSEVSLHTIRQIQRGAFPDMRMIDLSSNLRSELIKQPILEDLLCTRVGFQGPSPAHYIPRPEGSFDYIMIFCTEGRGWLELDDKKWLISKNNAFLVPRHTPHKYGSDPKFPWSNYWVHFQGRQGAAFADLIARPASPIIHLYRHEEVVACIEQLYQYMGNMHAYPEMVAASGALSQLLSLIQFRMHSAAPKTRTVEENIERTIKFMHKNLSKSLNLRDFAYLASMSPNHYGMLFSKYHSRSPMDYFNRLKIQKSCELLKTTNLRICEIGESLGFVDAYYFSRLFKKISGISPRNYRQN